eukprot:scaffold2590_cov160-Amphora_coffeaeformis.AAC.10
MRYSLLLFLIHSTGLHGNGPHGIHDKAFLLQQHSLWRLKLLSYRLYGVPMQMTIIGHTLLPGIQRQLLLFQESILWFFGRHVFDITQGPTGGPYETIHFLYGHGRVVDTAQRETTNDRIKVSIGKWQGCAGNALLEKLQVHICHSTTSRIPTKGLSSGLDGLVVGSLHIDAHEFYGAYIVAI